MNKMNAWLRGCAPVAAFAVAMGGASALAADAAPPPTPRHRYR
ncbi:hypothetical protein [Novacetimonas hansenii]